MTDLEKNGRFTSTSVLAPLTGERYSRSADYVAGSGGAPQQEGESLFAEYMRLIVRRRGAILLLTLLGALAAFCLTMTKLPVYRARTSLDIQNLNADFMDRRAIAPTGEGGDSSAESYVQTQIKLLQSDTLRERTVERMRLDWRVQSLERGDMLSNIKRRLHLGVEPLSRNQLLDFAARNVSVKPLGVTRLVEVTCDSWNQKFSADFCNALTTEFAAQDREVRWNEAQKTSEWLTRQVADIRQSLTDSEKKLENATGDDGLILTQGGGTVAEEKLRQLQAELLQAQADRVAKQAQYDISVSAPADSLPSVLDSGPLRDYEMKLAELRRQVAALVPPLTEANPKVQHLRAEIREVEATLAAAKANVMERLHNEFQAAQHRESLLSTTYNTQERVVSRDLSKQNQLSMLRHEVDSGQQLYQTLLQRVKEAGFASAMQVSTIRVVDAAQVAKLPITPRQGPATAVGLLLGFMSGIMFAFFKERTQTALRVPGDVARYLHLRELGVIPSARFEMQSTASRRRLAGAASTTRLLAPVGSEQRNDNREQAIDVSSFQEGSSLIAEAYRNTTYSILRAKKTGQRAKTYVISSPGVSDGKTTVTCNLGFALAQANRRVLLIDGDLRRPRLHEAVGVKNTFGLRDLLRAGVQDANTTELSYQPTKVPNLFVIPTGTGREEPSALLHSAAMADLLRRVARDFDIVLIDTPPVLHMADARILAGASDGVILVFRARTTARQTAMAARDLFLDDNIEVIGTILNDFNPLKEGQGKYYSSYYQYQAGTNGAEGAAGRA
ncbi:MAG: polysaccharide biosynthesis tyrosine autokinase [Acidobacteriota bacterium]|nr:polysaccharide biosynthesis tyrosine autokinase [Acidobacteriota bacterium]